MTNLLRHYVNVAGGVDLDVVTDVERDNKVADLARVSEIEEIEALSDTTRTRLAACAGAVDLVAYDVQILDEKWEIQDRLDYYTLYSNRTQNLTVRDGAWFTPDSVDSFCGETGGDVVGQSIDGTNSTVWKHSVNERHSVVYLLRDYPKKVSRIRFRYNSTEPAVERLTNLDVHAAKNVANIDDAENILETGINITWPTGQGSTWVEHTLAQKKAKARYIKLVFDTAHSQNTAQVREFAVWVETRDP